MAAANPPTAEAEATKAAWLARLGALVSDVETWSRELGWATKRIDKPMDDSDGAGKYRAPALVLQENFTRLMLEPIWNDGPDGVAHLYAMPEYDEVARLTLRGSAWGLKYPLPGMTDEDSAILDKSTLASVLAGLLARDE